MRATLHHLNDEKKRTRPRGFASWNPDPASHALVQQVLAVLLEYTAYVPLTVRQIFYRLVGARNYEKTERAYKRLAELINRARRCGLIEFASTRDDGIDWRMPFCWDSPAELVQSFISSAENFTLDRQEGQPKRLIIAVEAAGMAPQIGQITNPFGIGVIPSGGFNSVTATHDMAQQLGKFAAVEVLHIGDHDPSGIHIFSSLAEDVQAFALGLDGSVPKFTRLAVTPAQIAEHDLPKSPAKDSDPRSFEGETTQVESLPPDVLAEIIRTAITDRLDQAAFEAVLAREEVIKAKFRRTLLPALRRIERS